MPITVLVPIIQEKRMTSKEIVEEAVAAILKDDRSYCDCRRSPFDGHDVNPPCETRIRVTEQVRLTLEIAEPYMQRGEPEIPKSKPQWAIFGASSLIDAEPIIPARFPSRESALAYIKEHFPSPQFLQVRGRTITGWAV
jgi:hypothetical protein